METTRLHAAERPLDLAAASAQAPLQPGVEAFVETLRREHQRFLAAVGDAGARLGKDAAALAGAAALHTRLTRQFLDAQRSILCQHAQTAAEVERIEREAEADAATLMAGARRRAAAMSVHPACGRPDSAVSTPTTPAPTLSAPVDSAALAEIVDQVFQPRAADGETARRQLTELLDHWWACEQQEARAKVDDATARAAVRRHQAGLEAAAASASIGAIPTLPIADGGSAAAPLPNRLVAILDAAGTADLDGLFEALLDSLEEPVAAPSATVPAPLLVPAPTPLADGAIIRFEPSPVIALHGSDEAFERFWAKEPAAPAAPTRRTRWRHHALVVVPATMVSSLVVLALAWVG